MSTPADFNALEFRDTSFAGLMGKRITRVLLIAARYDAFILEDGGRIEEQIFNEYTALSLHYAPRITQVSTEKEALAALKHDQPNLVICMPNMDDSNIFAIINHIKRRKPNIPVVVLTPFSHEVTKRLANEDLHAVDYVFSWMGNTELLIAIIKLIEDRMNVDADIRSAGVQTILLVEDSVRFYSVALPHLYKFVLNQSKEFSKEALNAHEQTLRMRGRPKILLARTYEEAMKLYRRYRDNMLGVVCDMSFMRKGKKDPKAGYRFGQYVRKNDRHLPFILDSSESNNSEYAKRLGFSFIDKNSKTFPQDLHREIMENFGFGDFVLRDPETGREVERIVSIKDLQDKILTIPENALVYHLAHNHFSRFFFSRAIFPIAQYLKAIDVTAFNSIDEAREKIFEAIVSYRKMKNSGTVAVFERDRFDEYSNFARIGNDSLGGKGRGLAFVSQALKMRTTDLKTKFENCEIKIPKTLVLCSDIFDEFMETNRLYPFAKKEQPDEKILERFLRARLPKRLIRDMLKFLEVVKTPIVVRSSSLLEDAQYQPFAGIYKTYMVAPADDAMIMLERVGDAIKGVYASVFYNDSRSYLTATQNVIDQEKMAVVLQEMVGNPHGERYYPTFSGVARSLNYYPVANEQIEEGIANLALGLGKYIVDGGLTLRFSPLHPQSVLQTSAVEYALKETQTRFYALNLKDSSAGRISTDDAWNLLKIPVREADTDGELQFITSTYDHAENRLLDGYYPGTGRNVVTFVGVLKNGVFPLAEILDYILKMGQADMGRPVEIEFAVNMSNRTFYLLQLRPVAAIEAESKVSLHDIDKNDCLLYSSKALGNGLTNDIHDVIYVKTDDYNPKDNAQIAAEIAEINSALLAAERPYILIGPGRWGSSDPWLGIPVRWSQIAGARLIVELGLENYRPEPSQGTHFFHNLTSFGVGYFNISQHLPNGGTFDETRLKQQPTVNETSFVRHIRFEKPLTVMIDGRKGEGTVLLEVKSEK